MNEFGAHDRSKRLDDMDLPDLQLLLNQGLVIKTHVMTKI